MPTRRSRPRVSVGRAVDGVLHVAAVGRPDLTVLHCRDLSPDGFVLNTNVAVSPRVTMTFVFSYGTVLRLTVAARCVYCRTVGGHHPHYVTAWEFVIDNDEAVHAIATLVHCLNVHRH